VLRRSHLAARICEPLWILPRELCYLFKCMRDIIYFAAIERRPGAHTGPVRKLRLPAFVASFSFRCVLLLGWVRESVVESCHSFRPHIAR
jgi:hypothetical protein